MGQKVHPYGFRLGYTKPWKSRWFAERDYDKQLFEDVKLKNELREKLKSAGVSSIEIERPGNKLRIIIKTARPGIIIGRKGAEIDKLKAELQGRTKGKDVFVDIQEVHKPELDAQLVSEAIALSRWSTAMPRCLVSAFCARRAEDMPRLVPTIPPIKVMKTRLAAIACPLFRLRNFFKR